MPTYTLTTLGCKVNQYDGCALAGALDAAGMTPFRLRIQPPQATGPCDDESEIDAPDLVAVNTCCITRTAMRKSRQAIRRAVRSAPGAAVVVIGCYSDYDAARIEAMMASLGVPPSGCVVGGHHDGDLPERIKRLVASLRGAGFQPAPQHSPKDCATGHCTGQAANEAGMQASAMGDDGSMSALDDARARTHTIIPNSELIKANRVRAIKHNLSATRGLPPIREFSPNGSAHQRAFVKVQDGCDAFCAYCIMPYARSVVWSRSVRDITDECTRLVAAGYKEIVLAGVFLGAYGRQTAIRKRWSPAPAPLIGLIRSVAAIDGLWRLRLSSLEPGDLTDDLLDLFRGTAFQAVGTPHSLKGCAPPTLAPHFHLPLQSGSEAILKAMNRQYTARQFRRTVRHVRDRLDDAAITTDIIVGFPGETDEDFAQTLELAGEAGFAKIHAFPFSAIEGTAAWTRRDRAPSPDVVRQRLGRLAQLEREMAMAFRQRFVGRTMDALVESPRVAQGLRQGMTDRYLTVRFAAPPGDLTGQVVSVLITDATEDGLDGTLTGD